MRLLEYADNKGRGGMIAALEKRGLLKRPPLKRKSLCGTRSPTGAASCICPRGHLGDHHSEYGVWPGRPVTARRVVPSRRDHDLDLFRARAWSLRAKSGRR